jgi:hypothetical protein
VGGGAGATAIGPAILEGLSAIGAYKCTIGYPGGIETALCTKYGELLGGVTAIITTVSSNPSLGAVSIAGLGTAATWSVKALGRGIASAASASFGAAKVAVKGIVDYICIMLYGSDAERSAAAASVGVQTDPVPDPEARAKAKAAGDALGTVVDGPKKGQRLITEFTRAKGGRRSSKTRKTPRKLGKSRRARRRTARTPLFIY